MQDDARNIANDDTGALEMPHYLGTKKEVF